MMIFKKIIIVYKMEPEKRCYEKNETNETNETKGRSYLDVKNEFELYNFLDVGSSVFYDMSNNNITIRSEHKLKTSYRSLKFTEIKGNVESKFPFIKRWIKDQNIRKYSDVGLFPPPLTCPDGTFNLWTGLSIDKHNVGVITDELKDDLNFLKNHIFMLSNKDPDIYDFLLKWMAHVVQKPGDKTRVAILIKSSPGIGKKLGLFVPLSTIIGEKFCLCTPDYAKDIFGEFNDMVRNKILVVLDNMKMHDSIKYTGHFNALISRNETTINERWVRQKNIISLENCMSFSKYGLIVANNDRRFFQIDASSQPVPDKSYIERLVSIVNNLDVLKLFSDELKNICIGMGNRFHN